MGRHVERRGRRLWRPLSSVRVRAVLALGVLLGFGAVNTFAYWTDSATISGGSFQAGTLDMKVNGNQGNPTPYPWTAFALSDMVPGESVAASIPLQNVGSVDFTYTATASGTGDLLPEMRFETYVGGAATNVPANGLRKGSCSGTSTGEKTVTQVAQPVITSPQAVVANTGSQSVCIVATLSSAAPNSAQGKSASVTVTFNAKQVGAP